MSFAEIADESPLLLRDVEIGRRRRGLRLPDRSVEARRFGGNQSETLNNPAQIWKRKETGANDDGGK